MRCRTGLALGSGAARGYAHLGVLQVFQEEKIPIDLVSGCSIGSVFGALYAKGLDLYFLEKIAGQLRQNQFMDPTVPRVGLLKGKKVEALIRFLTKNARFNQLDIPFYAVAVDLVKGEEVVLAEGSVAEAVRVSISVPGIFQPKELQGRFLVDGAVLNSLPTQILRKKGAELVIGVDLHSGKGEKMNSSVQNIFDVLLRSLDLLNREAYEKALEEADVVISPAVENFHFANFEKAVDCIPLGREAAKREISRIKELLKC